MKELYGHKPLIMAAINGARYTKQDHPNIPISVEEIITDSIECYEAGAGAVHLHVRDEKGQHCLDEDLYRQVITGIKEKLSDRFVIQITTESAGLFTLNQQIELIYQLKPQTFSLALKEAFPEALKKQWPKTTQMLKFCKDHNITIQWILYEPSDIERLEQMLLSQSIPSHPYACLFVLGRYEKNLRSYPETLMKFIDKYKKASFSEAPWMVCAFGKDEIKLASMAIKLGGHARIGFENSFYLSDASVAQSNAEKVKELKRIYTQSGDIF